MTTLSFFFCCFEQIYPLAGTRGRPAVLAGHMSKLEAKKGPSGSSGRGDTRTRAEDAFFRESNPHKKEEE